MQASIAVPERPRPGEENRAALAVFVVVAVGLLLGWLLMVSIEGRTTSFSGLDGALTLRYPAPWMASKAETGTVLSVADPVSSGGLRPALKVYVRSLAQGQTLMDAATAWTMGRMKALREFRDLGTETMTIAGRPALRVNYGYVADPPAGTGAASLPIVARASDTIVVQGSQYVVFSAVGDANQDGEKSAFASILASVKLTGK